MKVLLVRGNPRKNGYTQALTELLVRGLHEGGADLIDRDLCALDVHHCQGCYACWLSSPGRCVLRDDMARLMDDVLRADLVVCATPLYGYSSSSRMKAFLDRLLPLTRPSLEVMANGLPRNALRFPQHWPKKLAVMMVGAFKGAANFEGAQRVFSLLAGGLHMELCGVLTRPESYLLQFSLAKPVTIKTIEAAYARAGYELATAGAISQKTKADAETPLSADMEHFSRYSNIYWEHAVAAGGKAGDVAALQREVTGDVRILMQEMARCCDSAATARVKAVLQFDFPDKDYHYRVAIDRGACVLTEETSARPDLRVTVSTAVWAGVFTREISARDALVDRRIVLEGDKSLFSKLDRYFPPPTI